MKKLTLAAICLIGTMGSAVADGLHGCPEKDTAYSAYTSSWKKAIELCQEPGGFRFTYGPVGKVEVSVFEPFSNVMFDGGMGNGFEFTYGNIVNTVNEDKYGNALFYILNVANGETILTVDLDTVNDGYINETYRYR